jgi:hypothetical protein
MAAIANVLDALYPPPSILSSFILKRDISSEICSRWQQAGSLSLIMAGSRSARRLTDPREARAHATHRESVTAMALARSRDVDHKLGPGEGGLLAISGSDQCHGRRRCHALPAPKQSKGGIGKRTNEGP